MRAWTIVSASTRKRAPPPPQDNSQIYHVIGAEIARSLLSSQVKPATQEALFADAVRPAARCLSASLSLCLYQRIKELSRTTGYILIESVSGLKLDQEGFLADDLDPFVAVIINGTQVRSTTGPFEDHR